MKHIFVSRRTRLTAVIVSVALPILLSAYAWFMNHRPALHRKEDWTWQDTLLQNSDLLLAALFLLVSALPFYFVFDKRRAQARDLVPIALMTAVAVAGRGAFALVPLPNFKPVTAVVVITAVAFGPEAGYLTGALTGFISNFLFGQGPWTPWQMFSWGMIGFIAGLFHRMGWFGKLGAQEPDAFGKRKKPFSLCVFGFCAGVGYGWIMNLYHVVRYVDPFSWKAAALTYATSLFFDCSHGLCTALVLWFVAEPWTRKLIRIKRKFGLHGGKETL